MCNIMHKYKKSCIIVQSGSDQFTKKEGLLNKPISVCPHILTVAVLVVHNYSPIITYCTYIDFLVCGVCDIAFTYIQHALFTIYNIVFYWICSQYICI